jgi:pyroglutamyl-peptidase
MKRILLCAFDPFGGESINPALEAVRAVKLDGAEVEKCEVPTVFYKSVEVVLRKIEKFSPDAVVMIGQAGGRDKITPERVAINLSDARIAYNEGNMPCDEPIVSGAPAAYFSTLPIKEIVRVLGEGGIPSAVSNSAGTFVCNHLMYGVLHYIAERGLDLPAGFIHIPYLPEQVTKKEGVASLPLELDVRAIEMALGVIIKQISEEK